MKQNNIIFASVLLIFLFSAGCGRYLDVNPKQVLDDNILNSPKDVDGFVTAAYARLTDVGSLDAPFQSKLFGSIRSDDSYKAGGGTWDLGGWHDMELFVNVNPNNWPIDYPWYVCYQIIQRCNTAIRHAQQFNDQQMPAKNSRIGEAMFIRSFVYMTLKQLFKYVPYIDEKVVGTTADFEAIPNREIKEPNDLYLWQHIADDFKTAESLLPMVQDDKGRVDKNAATAMVAKALLFMAYEQDGNNQVVNINKARLEEALTYINKLTAQEGSKVALEPDFGNNFQPQYDNNTKESLWELQFSLKDGSSTGGKINRNEGLFHPWNWAGFICCGFHQISYSTANAFKTGADGLPMFDTYNNDEYSLNNASVYFNKYTWDPRFNHTIVAPGQPYKYNSNLIFTKEAIRDAADYGYLKSQKELVRPDCGCLLYDGWQFNSMNQRILRYDEVLLWQAEILIQLDRITEALVPINKIRTRAANSTGLLRMANGNPVMNYKVENYKPGVNCNWTKEFAWKALQWEARLEMAGEGRRFFDLQRWGILEKTMNDYFAAEKPRRAYYSPARFSKGRDEFLPIPQNQINWAKGNYTQNVGY
jgi:hypothetical protein